MSQQFGVQLPATVAFDYPTPAALADCIASRLPASTQQAELSLMQVMRHAPVCLMAPVSKCYRSRLPFIEHLPYTHLADYQARILCSLEGTDVVSQ